MTVIPFRAPDYDGSASGPRVYPGPDPVVRLRVVEPNTAHVPESLPDYEAGQRPDWQFIAAVAVLSVGAVLIFTCLGIGAFVLGNAAVHVGCAGLEWMGRAV